MHRIRKYVVKNDVIFHIGRKRYINRTLHIIICLFRGTTLMGPNITIPLPLSVLLIFSCYYFYSKVVSGCRFRVYSLGL